MRRRLLVLVTAALLPLTLASVVGLVLLGRHQHKATERGAIETMRALMIAVDLELERAMAGLEALAVSRALARDDIARFYEDARRVAAVHPTWRTIILAAPDGRQLLNLQEPFVGPALPTVEIETFQRAVATRRAIAGNLAHEAVSQAPAFTVRVPIVRGDEVRYVLTGVIDPRAMVQVIEQQEVPADSVISILDARGIHVARSRRHAEFVGRAAAPSLQDLMRRAGREGWDRTTTLEGQPVYAAFRRSARTGWAVALGIPASVVEGGVRRSIGLLGAGVVLSLALGAGAAALIARGITRPIGHLRTAAQAVGRGETPDLPRMPILEVAEVGEALLAAAEARREAEVEREHVLVRERQARTLAEDASRAKDEFLAMLGHELRNPLAAIANAQQVFDTSGGTGEVAMRARSVIGRQVQHLRRLVDDLLDVGRVVTGKIVLERAPADLARVVEHALATMSANGVTRAHRVVTVLEPAWVNGDSTRLEQIVTNLVGNAVKFTVPGRSIHVTVRRDGGAAVLRVTDEGVGMSAELLPSVFDLFVQGPRSIERAQGGLGIGLTLVRRLSDLHGGIATAESAGEGGGSTFTVQLPAIEAPVNSPVPDAHAAPAPRRNVVVVEDNDDARDMLVTLLRMDGHDVVEARDGESGLETVLRVHPDVVFIDVGLPNLDGFEVARRVRAAHGIRPVLVALTGYALAEDRRRAHEAGFDVHLAKPVAPEAIRDVLRRA